MSKLKPRKTENGKNIKSRNKENNDKFHYINHPVFCFNYISKKGYSFNDCDDQEKLDLINKLTTLSNMTWAEIQLSPKHGLGSEKIAIKSIKTKLPNNFTEDVSFLLALRFSGKKAMVGYRNEFIFHVFFLDRDFTLYPH